MQGMKNSIASTATKALKYTGGRMSKMGAGKHDKWYVKVGPAGYICMDDLKMEKMQAQHAPVAVAYVVSMLCKP